MKSQKKLGKVTVKTIRVHLDRLEDQANTVLELAQSLDPLGDAEQHAPGSKAYELAVLRDEADRFFAHFALGIAIDLRVRAEFSRSSDLLIMAAQAEKGDGDKALRLMRRLHEFCPDDAAAPDGFPDSFAWETYLRVAALAKLVTEFPDKLKLSAAQMHGWPMIVAAHLDVQPEFQRIRECLSVGAEYPLDVGPRRRRGSESAMLRYLEPLIWRLHVTRLWLLESEDTRSSENFAQRLYCCWWEHPDSPPTSEAEAILRKLIKLPPLTRRYLPRWCREVIVPIIMEEDGASASNCTEPALKNIWRHRGVKSAGTFRSRLTSAVLDTLTRFARD